MTKRMLPLIASALLALVLAGCASTPTPNQEAMASSGVRLATVAYITRGKDAAAQSKRAAQVLEVSSQVRGYVSENGDVVLSLDAAAAVANARIQASDLSASDKALAQAIVVEAALLASDQAAALGGNIGAENARVLLKLLGEIERTATVFGPAPG